MTKYIGDDLPSKVSDLVNISIEAMIAEIVDNSLDKQSTKIEIVISGKNWMIFSIITYDNSPIGFSSEQELDMAFRMGGKKNEILMILVRSTWVLNLQPSQNLEILQYSPK